jgi:uncharacterized protein YecT (DUF1311 family)
MRRLIDPALRFAIAATVVASALACWSCGAFGAEPEVPKEKPQELFERLQDECAEESLLGAITVCLREKEEAFGKQLDQVYKKALTLAGTNKPLLRESQRNWLKYQESNCKLQGQLATEGEMYKRNHKAHCLLRMTLERLEELREIESELGQP